MTTVETHIYELPQRPVYFGAPGEVLSIDDIKGEEMQTIADCIGIKAALTMLSYFGGSRLYIPATMADDHKLSVIGKEAGEKLCRMYGGARVDIPKMALTDRALRRLIDARLLAGQTIGKIAFDLGLSWRTTIRLGSVPPEKRPKRSRHAGPNSSIKSDARLTPQGSEGRSVPNQTSQNTNNPASGHFCAV